MSTEPAEQPDAEDSKSEESLRKTFTAFLHEQRGGGLHGELTEKLIELVGAVMDHEKAGTLTLTVKVKPAEGSDRTVFVTDEVKAKIPEADRGSSLFFVDSRDQLTRRNPRQPELPLREVPAPKPAEHREI